MGDWETSTQRKKEAYRAIGWGQAWAGLMFVIRNRRESFSQSDFPPERGTDLCLEREERQGSGGRSGEKVRSCHGEWRMA